MQTPNPETPPAGTSRIPNLADWRFNRYLTMQLMPLFYLLLIVGALVVVVSIVGLCFWFSMLAGIIATAIAPLALLVIVALWFVIAAALVLFWNRDRIAGLLLLPYLAWVGYAAYLNAGLVWLN